MIRFGMGKHSDDYGQDNTYPTTCGDGFNVHYWTGCGFSSGIGNSLGANTGTGVGSGFVDGYGTGYGRPFGLGYGDGFGSLGAYNCRSPDVWRKL